MQLRSALTLFSSSLGLLLTCMGIAANAQTTARLYDPEPPVDSAYVRVIFIGKEAPVDVVVDGRPRVPKLKGNEPSDYMVLSLGKHNLALHPAGKPTAMVSTTLDVVRGRPMTVAFPALRADATPIFFEDKTISNKLKSLLSVYHLDPKTGPLDLLTADGKTQVFANLAQGTPASIQVNPISVDLIATKAGDKSALTRTSLAMTQGGSYSVFLLPSEGGKLQAKASQNKTERYTGK